MKEEIVKRKKLSTQLDTHSRITSALLGTRFQRRIDLTRRYIFPFLPARPFQSSKSNLRTNEFYSKRSIFICGKRSWKMINNEKRSYISKKKLHLQKRHEHVSLCLSPTSTKEKTRLVAVSWVDPRVEVLPCSNSYWWKMKFLRQGECHRMGCDRVLGSKKALDTCGVCDGDNSSCENIVNKFQRKLRRGQSSHRSNWVVASGDEVSVKVGQSSKRRGMQRP